MKMHRQGFTLIELLVVVAIMGIAAVIGVNAIQSRVSEARIEGAAEALATDLSNARAAAILKQCPTRIVICQNFNCGNISTQGISAQTSGSVTYIGTAAGPASYYAVIRQTTPCAAQAGVAAAEDGLANWDFDVKPRKLPSGTIFKPIYTGAGSVISYVNADAAVGASLTHDDVGNSLWFDRDAAFYIPVNTNLTSTGNFIVFQISSDGCNPATEDSCYGYFVTMSPGGETATRPCAKGNRVNSSDICF